jgi:hypothetical protein
MIATFAVTHGNLASITLCGRIPVIAHGLRFEAYFRRQVQRHKIVAGFDVHEFRHRGAVQLAAASLLSDGMLVSRDR